MSVGVADSSGLIRSITHWLSIIAFVAAAAFLWNSDLATEVRVASLPFLLAATVVQLLAFSMRAWLLQDMLRRFGATISLPGAIACTFKPILSKYIPGKIWLLVSTAGMLNTQGVALRSGSLILGVFQVVLAISGLVLGGMALLAFQLPGIGAETRMLLILLPMAMLTALIGSGSFLAWACARIPRLGKWSASVSQFPSLSAPAIYAVVHWLVIGAAFALFLRAVNVEAAWYAILFQPLATNLGVLAFMLPGGLGVREAAMAAYLTLADIPLSYGLSLAIAARLWFFAGEVLAFFLGLLVEHWNE
jgi:uncharacterized membrane protein YbhN (UPF0104 family)